MTESRLTENGADAFESALLSSAKDDRMSASRKRALVAAFGATAGAAMVNATAAGVAGAPGAAAGANVAATKAVASAGAKASATIVLKWVGAAVLGSTLAVGAGAAVSRVIASRTSPATVVSNAAGEEPPIPMPPPSAVPTPVAVTAPIPQPAIEPPASASPTALVARGPSRDRTAPTARAPALRPVTSTRSGLADEVQLVEQARTSLATGDVVSARRALDAHARKFPHGVLADEASVLWIDLLAASGDHAGAERAARAYLASHPAGPHAPRVREFLLGGEP